MQRNLQQQKNTNSARAPGAGLAWSLLLLTVIYITTSCGTTPKRPVYSGTDNVGALKSDAFVGNWRYTILNPSVEQEKNFNATYRFKPDGSFTANAEVSSDFPMKMESIGTWKIDGEMFVISVEDIKETSGNEIAALALNFTKGWMQKQAGTMNPYSISSNQIVMVSPEHGSALQLDRL